MRVATSVVAASLTVLAPATALADSGVHVDPGSPSKHQYVIPVNAARGEANSGSHGSGGGSQLFGNGVKAGSSSSGGSSPSAGSAGGAVNAQHSKQQAVAHPGQKGLHPTYTLASGTHSPGSSASGGDGGSGWVPLVAGGAAVLLLGGGGGLALRRRLVRT